MFLMIFNAHMVVVRKTGLTDTSDVLEAMGACRKAMVKVSSAYPHNSAIYREANVMIRNIDDLALLFTGDKEYFWDEAPKIG